VDKSFDYNLYEKNLQSLRSLIRKTGWKHQHLKRYSLSAYRDALNRSKVLLFPSPKEAGASLCHALLECSMMDVPCIGLKQVLLVDRGEFPLCRGHGVDSVKEMIDCAATVINRFDSYHPREWVIQRHSIQSVYPAFQKILGAIHGRNNCS
jgi:hypothetical protein